MVALRGNELIRFHSASPGTTSAAVGDSQACGSPASQLVGIDMRPADGQLYGVGSSSRVAINRTGASIRSAPAFRPCAMDASSASTSIPQVDRLRIVSNTEHNLRIQPPTGDDRVVVTPL